MADIGFTDDVSPSSPVQKCSICGKRLSSYNRLGRCFHHPDPEKEHRQQQREAQRVLLLPQLPPAPESPPKEDTGPEPEVVSEEILRERVITTVCAAFGIGRTILEAGGRQEHVVRARHVLMYLLYIDTALSYPAIGQLLGGRDHTTVIHGVSRISEALETDSSLQNLVRYLRSKYR